MNEKHIQIRIDQCLVLSNASNCSRRKFGALLIDPVRNVILMDGYNGGPRGGGKLCDGDRCFRDDNDVESGTMIEHGCHHAEMNVICNAAANGVKTEGAWLFINGEPCLLCSKLIHHSGIEKVIIISGGFIGVNGIDYLLKNKIIVEERDGPIDPRIK
jgi:dCMP deaminase